MVSEHDHLQAVQRQLERKRDGLQTKIQEIDDAIAGLRGATALLKGEPLKVAATKSHLGRPPRRVYGEVARITRDVAETFPGYFTKLQLLDAVRGRMGRLSATDRVSIYNVYYRLQQTGKIPQVNGFDQRQPVGPVELT